MVQCKTQANYSPDELPFGRSQLQQNEDESHTTMDLCFALVLDAGYRISLVSIYVPLSSQRNEEDSGS